MITDEMLRNAATIADATLLDMLPDEKTCLHTFSPSFEQKMHKLARRARHPLFYQTMQRAACFIFVLVLSGSTWLAANADALTPLWDWIRESYESLFAYYFSADIDLEDTQRYALSWVPEGYTMLSTVELNGNITVQYENAVGQRIRFSYIFAPSETNWYLDESQTTRQTVTVNGIEADLLLANNEEVASVLLWTAPDSNTAFYISAFCNQADLLKMAESITTTVEK